MCNSSISCFVLIEVKLTTAFPRKEQKETKVHEKIKKSDYDLSKYTYLSKYQQQLTFFRFLIYTATADIFQMLELSATGELY